MVTLQLPVVAVERSGENTPRSVAREQLPVVAKEREWRPAPSVARERVWLAPFGGDVVRLREMEKKTESALG